MKRAPLNGIEVFLAIVKEGSMRAAADTLGIGAPAVSLQLKSLEERLGVDLLFRNTRNIELTDAGRVLFEASSPAYRDLLYAVQKSQETARSTTGTLRLSMSRGAYVAAVAPMIDQFLLENPGINLEISWNEELVDIRHRGFHAGVRLGDTIELDMIALQVSQPVQTTYFAAPSYLEKHGHPEHPRDLLGHQCIRYRQPTSGKILDWWMVENGHEARVDAPARLTFDVMNGVIQAACEGLGIGWSMRKTMEAHIHTGELEPILQGFSRVLPPFYLYYPRQNRRVECLRLFIDCIRKHFKQSTKR